MRIHQRWNDYPTVVPTGNQLLLRGRRFQPLADQLMRMQLLWQLGPRRGLRVPMAAFTDEVRTANPTELGRSVDRPADIGQDNYLIVSQYMDAALASVQLPARPVDFIWCAELPANMSYVELFDQLYTRQNKSAPTSHADARIIRDLVRDLEFDEP